MEDTEARTETLQQEVDLTPKMEETMAEMITTMMDTMQENIWKKLEDYIVCSEASHDAEVATIEATNDWDASRPPHGLQTSPDVVDQYLADPQQSQLSWEQISQEFSVAEKTAPAIDEKLAQLVSSFPEMSKITCRCGVCSYSSNHEGFRRVEALIDPLSGPCSFRQLGI